MEEGEEEEEEEEEGQKRHNFPDFYSINFVRIIPGGEKVRRPTVRFRRKISFLHSIFFRGKICQIEVCVITVFLLFIRREHETLPSNNLREFFFVWIVCLLGTFFFRPRTNTCHHFLFRLLLSCQLVQSGVVRYSFGTDNIFLFLLLPLSHLNLVPLPLPPPLPLI